jgi:hypothetical protein
MFFFLVLAKNDKTGKILEKKKLPYSIELIENLNLNYKKKTGQNGVILK